MHRNSNLRKMKLIELFNKDLTPNWDVFEKTFPEMSTCHHSERWHKEGSATNHTRLVAEEMYKRVSQLIGKDEDRYIIMMSAAMLHDIGNPSTTYWDEKQGDWCCKSHGEAGERLFRNIFFDERLDLREKVAYLIRYHMLLHHTLQKGKERQERELIQLMNGLMPFEDMLLLNECDLRGSINEENTEENISSHINSLNEAVATLKSEGKDNQWKYADERSAKMFVMIGIPGCGKSTYAEYLQKNELIRGVMTMPIVSRDLIRIEMGLCGEGEKCMGSKKEEDDVTRRVEEQIKGLSSMGASFIVDNTSLKKKYRDQYIDYISKYDVVPIYVYVEAPSLDENYNRRDGQIDKDIIKRMWDGMEFPNRSECYELWLVDERTNETYKL